MGIVRIVFPHAATAASYADAVESRDSGIEPHRARRAAREVRRAATRPGRRAELTCEEAIEAASVAARMSPAAAELARAAAEDARGVLARDEANLTARHDAMDQMRRYEVASGTPSTGEQR